MFEQKLYQVGVVGQDVHRPRFNGRANLWMEILDLVRHPTMLARTLTARKWGFCDVERSS